MTADPPRHWLAGNLPRSHEPIAASSCRNSFGVGATKRSAVRRYNLCARIWDRPGARTSGVEAWSSAARRANVRPHRVAFGSCRQAADRLVSAFVIPRSSRCCRPKRRRPVHFLVTRQRRSGASVAAILGRIASHDRSTSRPRRYGNLTKGLSSHHPLGEGND